MNKALGGDIARVRVGMVTTDSDFSAELREFLAEPQFGIELTTVVSAYAALLDAVRAEKLQVVLVDTDQSEDLAGFLGQIREAGVSKVILLVSDMGDPRLPSLMALATTAGAELVYKYSLGHSLVDAIRRLPAGGTSSKQTAGGRGKQSPAPPRMAPSLHGESGLPQVNVVYSPKGGSGKTTVAIHIALSYASRGLRTALVDLAQFGSIPSLLRLPPKGKGLAGIITILQQEPQAASEPRFAGYIEEAMVECRFPGGTLDILPAGPPTKMDQLAGGQVAEILRRLVQMGYEAVVVDTSCELSERNVEAFEAATRILLLLTPDIACAWHCLQAVEVLQALLIPRDRLALVASRFRRDVYFNLEEVRGILDLPLAGILPETARTLQGAANRGAIRLPSGRFGYPAALRQLTDRLCPPSALPTHPRMTGSTGKTATPGGRAV